MTRRFVRFRSSFSSLAAAPWAFFSALLFAGCPELPEGFDAGPKADAGACVAEDPCAADTCGLVVDQCGEEVFCGSCVTIEQLEELMLPVDRMQALFETRSYMSDVIDLDPLAIRQAAVDTLKNTPDPEVGLLTALARTMRAYRNGHAGFYSMESQCRYLGGGDVGRTAYGVCAKPAGDDFIVTHQPGAQNPLGLSPGDRVVAWNGERGVDMVRAVLEAPLCGNGAGNHDVDQEHAAESLFGVLRPGDVLEVLSPGGEERTITAGAPTSAYPPCRFPAGPTDAPLISLEVRDDGVAVLRLRRFALFPGEPGYIAATTEAEALQLIANMTEQVREVFDAVPEDAIGIIWDVRGNIGGASHVGFAIAAGMPGARFTDLARCTTRIPESDPIEYWAYGPNYSLEPGGPFETERPTAVLIDGLSISAADYFALAVRQGTEARLFGRPSAGAYGGGGNGEIIDEERGYYAAFDPYRCNDLDGEPLETRSVEPHEWVEYEPEDLAAGLDTVEERAASWLLEQAGGG